MPVIVGIDESGYGPLLGPLVVAATAWRADAPADEVDFWQRLARAVCRGARRADARLRVDDSKRLFSQDGGLGPLERPVLAFAAALGLPRDSLDAFVRAVAGADGAQRPLASDQPWYARLDRPLPVVRAAAPSDATTRRLAETMDAAGVRCTDLAVRIVPEDAFNRRLRATRNKAAVNLEQVLLLVQRAVDAHPREPIHFLIDRLGGRTDYRSVLQLAFPDRALHVLEASEGRSGYRLTRAGRPDWTFLFAVQADTRYLPVALAGMLAKYCRELLMREFNAWWRRLDPALRPTAGYYTDARRFLADIAPLLPDAGLAPEQFVRSR